MALTTKAEIQAQMEADDTWKWVEKTMEVKSTIWSSPTAVECEAIFNSFMTANCQALIGDLATFKTIMGVS